MTTNSLIDCPCCKGKTATYSDYEVWKRDIKCGQCNYQESVPMLGPMPKPQSSEISDDIITKLAAIHDKLLTGPSVQNQIMRAWDSARGLIQEGDESDLPRSILESAIEDIQDDVEALMVLLSEHKPVIGNIDILRNRLALIVDVCRADPATYPGGMTQKLAKIQIIAEGVAYVD